jgi:hypothetical protein
MAQEPNQLLEGIRERIEILSAYTETGKATDAGYRANADELVEMFAYLDTWLTGANPLPAVWAPRNSYRQ